jgi:hypothetical protein
MVACGDDEHSMADENGENRARHLGKETDRWGRAGQSRPPTARCGSVAISQFCFSSRTFRCMNVLRMLADGRNLV